MKQAVNALEGRIFNGLTISVNFSGGELSMRDVLYSKV